MANFRTERVYLRVEDPLERFDPNAGIVAEDLADAVLNDPGESDNGSLSVFLLTPIDQPRWFASSAGAQAVHRRLEAVRQELLGPLTDIQRSGRERQQRALEGALERLAELRAAGRRFLLRARDLRPSKSPEDPAAPRHRSLPRISLKRMTSCDPSTSSGSSSSKPGGPLCQTPASGRLLSSFRSPPSIGRKRHPGSSWAG